MTGDVSCLLRGDAIGFSIAAPVGPIGVLCIRRTLAEGRVNPHQSDERRLRASG